MTDFFKEWLIESFTNWSEIWLLGIKISFVVFFIFLILWISEIVENINITYKGCFIDFIRDLTIRNILFSFFTVIGLILMSLIIGLFFSYIYWEMPFILAFIGIISLYPLSMFYEETKPNFISNFLDKKPFANKKDAKKIHG